MVQTLQNVLPVFHCSPEKYNLKRYFHMLLRKEWIPLAISLIIYLGIVGLFYPPFYTIIDEQAFSQQAVWLLDGKLFVTDPLEAYGTYSDGAKFFTAFPPGTSLFMIPFVLLGFKALFAYGVFVHILTFLVVVLILRRLRLPVVFGSLYLFYPIFVHSSVKLMSEPIATLFFLAGILFYLYSDTHSWKGILVGLCFGVVALIRYHNIVPVLPFYLIPLIRDRRRFLFQCLGFLPFAIIILLFNSVVYNHALNISYTFTFPHLTLDVQLFILIIASAFILLNSFYPFMLFTLAERFHLRLEFALAVGFQVFFYGFMRYFPFPFVSSISWPRVPIESFRYFHIVLPLLIISFTVFISRREAFFRKLVFYSLVVLALVSSVGYLYVNDLQASRISDISDAIYRYSDEGTLIIGFNAAIYHHDLLGKRTYIDGMKPSIPENSLTAYSKIGYPDSLSSIRSHINRANSSILVRVVSQSFKDGINSLSEGTTDIWDEYLAMSQSPRPIYHGIYLVDGPLSSYFDTLEVDIFQLT